MASASFLVCFLSLFVFCSCVPIDPPQKPYEVKYIEQFVDHFNELSFEDKTFKQKYLYSDKNWKKGGPIFFCIGNGPIEPFWEAAGFVHELAADLGAALVFAEQRFFGASMPFGEDSLKTPNFGELSMEQALADFAILINNVVKSSNCTDCKVITIGGSYGGMLAAYMRMKFPDIVHGALASSAPVFMQDPSTKMDFFFPQVTKVFQDTNSFCVAIIERLFPITELLSEDAAGLEALAKYFRLCEPLKNKDEYHYFLGWIRNAFSQLAIMNYPYAIKSLDLPAFPVDVSCKALTTARNAIYGLGDLVGVYYNGSRKLECYNMSNEYTPCADPSGCSVGPADISADYLSCTEVRSPSGTNGVTDMFPIMPWDDKMKADYCLQKYGVKPRLDWPPVEFWGKNLKATSNIIFSNGDLDPWKDGGVLENISDTVVAIEVKGGAHMLDLFASNNADPAGVTEARKQEKSIIQSWISK